MIHEHSMGIFPLTNPVLIFSLLLFIILVTPYIFRKLKIPHLIGLIIAGSIIGPSGVRLMLRDSSIELYGTVGLLYIMFIAGLEIDMADFKKNSHKSLVFGLLTFSIPMTLGTLSGLYVLNLPVLTSILVASLYASHTLVTYPIVSRYGITKNNAVNVTVGGTMITDILALLVLAVIVGMTRSELTAQFWINLAIYFSIFTFIVAYVFPKIARVFLKRENDGISQYLFILGLVFLAGFLAEISGVEAIIGAFLAGLSLNQLIPETSPLKNRIEFIGNALFIPIFLIGVGMLINFRVFFTDLRTIFIGLVMIVVATFSKFFAAYLTHKTFKFSKDQFYLIFGLSNSQAAATLAAVMVGYKIFFSPDPDSEPIRLITDSILDGTILMILATCTIASFATEKASKNISNELENNKVSEEKEDTAREKILIPVSHPDTLEELINLGLTIKDKKIKDNLYAVNILSTYTADKEHEMKAKKLLEKAAKVVSSADQILNELIRYDINISNGIYNIVKEQKITDIIIGLHQKKGLSDSFLGTLTEGILTNCNANTYIYHSVQPFNTLNKMVVVIPENAEKEYGFESFASKVMNIASNNGSKFTIFTSEIIIEYFKKLQEKKSIEVEYINFTDWEDFLIVSSKLQANDGLIVMMSRPGKISRNNAMNKMSKYFNKYFEKYNYIIVYPIQNEIVEEKKIKPSKFFKLKNL